MTMTKGQASNEEPNKQGSSSESNEDLRKIVFELKDQITKLQSGSGGMTAQDITNIATIVAETQKKLNEAPIDFQRGISSDKVPLEDYLETPVRFCAPYFGYIISDDIRMGHLVNLPYNKPFIFFEHIATRKTEVGKYSQVAQLSAYESKSKKEVEWLRNHSLYRIMFFENSTEATNVDTSRIVRMGAIMRSLQSLELNDLIKRCKEQNIDPNEDANIMRANIATAIIDKEFSSEQEKKIHQLEDTHKEAVLLGKADK